MGSTTFPRHAPPALALLLLACGGGPSGRTQAAPRTAPTTSPTTAAGAEADAGAQLADASTPAPPRGGSLSIVYQGICDAARMAQVGGMPATLFPHSAWLTDGGPRSLFRDQRPADMAESQYEMGRLWDAGGIDEGHAWIARISRMFGDGSYEMLLKARNWAPIPEAQSIHGYIEYLPRPDGSLWLVATRFPERPDALPMNYFSAWTSEGKPSKVNLPGPDMYLGTSTADGELVAYDFRKGKLMLLRWSPRKPVDDLVADAGPFSSEDESYEPGVWRMHVGTTRTYLLTPKQKAGRRIQYYDGEKISPSPLNGVASRLADLTSWTVTASDDVWVTTASGKVLFASKAGEVKEEALPEPAVLAGSRTPWLLATSGALYTHTGGTWQRVNLPGAADGKPAPKVESVWDVGEDTFIQTTQIRPGFGRPTAGVVRTMYATGRAAQPLRCGAPFPTNTLALLPPPAGETCAEPMVLVSGVRPGHLPDGYPKLAEHLKGLDAAGTTVTFVDFGSDGASLLGVATSSLDGARAVAKRLGGKVAYPPEILCGSPKTALRRTILDLATGTFRVL